jgi:hypothetical protein
MTRILTIAAVVATALAVSAVPASAQANPVTLGARLDPQVQIGGVTIALPNPPAELVPVDDNARSLNFDWMVRPNARLLAAYMEPKQFARINVVHGRMNPYAMVQSLKGAEHMDLAPDDFLTIASSASEGLDRRDVQEMQAEMERRLKERAGNSVTVEKPQMPGTIFQKTDEFGMIQVVPFQNDGQTLTTIMGTALLRVKQRLVCVYLYRTYESKDSLEWVKRNLEAWSDAIVAHNR